MQDLLLRYDAARTENRAHNAAIIRTLSHKAFNESARILQVQRSGGAIVVRPEELDLFHDCAIYDYVSAGINAVGRYAARSACEPGSVLDAMTRAEFTVLEIGELVPEVGARCFDIVFQREVLLVDRTLSRLGQVGQALATRLVDRGDFVMTSGMALGFPAEYAGLFHSAYENDPATPGATVTERADRAREILGFAMLDPDELYDALEQLAARPLRAVPRKRSRAAR